MASAPTIADDGLQGLAALASKFVGPEWVLCRKLVPDADAKGVGILRSLVERGRGAEALEQGSAGWFEARRDRFTGSKFMAFARGGAFDSQTKALTDLLHAKKLVPNHHMLRGTTLEPVARDLYVQETGRPMEERGMLFLEDYPFLGYSPDGVGTRLLEIKAPMNPYRDVPKDYMAQIQGGMWFLRKILGDGAVEPCCDFVQVRRPEGEEASIVVWTIARDDAYWAQMLRELEETYYRVYLPKAVMRDAGLIAEGEFEPTLLLEGCTDGVHCEPREPSILARGFTLVN